VSNRDSAELHHEIAQLRAELNHVAACSQNRDKENARLRSELAGVTAENKALQDQLDCVCNPEELRIAREDMQRLQADLARVTAQRNEAEEQFQQRLEIGCSALRARVAELERELTNSSARVGTFIGKLKQAEARNAELVAALRGAVGMLEELDGLDWGEEGMPFTVDFDHFAKLLARADSAAPKSDPNSSEIRMSESATISARKQGGAE